ncbi:protein argonaute-2 isoform X2 [Vespa velutina]|uniref:protein argonaute-2 isoform X2 n=1 Tax=Vespa velutina TaxID=202808 RepID=UPI001FB4FE5B|nr:protein argonaute-2 isoform X2 [Vespa velutina]
MGKKKGKKRSSNLPSADPSSLSQQDQGTTQQEQSYQQSSAHHSGHEKDQGSRPEQSSQQLQRSRQHVEGQHMVPSSSQVSQATSTLSAPQQSQSSHKSKQSSKSSSQKLPSSQRSQPPLKQLEQPSQKLQPSTQQSQPLPQKSQPLPQQLQPSQQSQPLPQKSQSWAQKLQSLPQKSQPSPQQSQPLPQQSQSWAQKSQPLPQQSQPLPQQLQPSKKSQPLPQKSQSWAQKSQPLPQQSQPLPQQLQPSQQSQPLPQKSQSWAQKSQPLPQQSQPLPQQLQPSQQSQPLPQKSLSWAQKSQPLPQQLQPSQQSQPLPQKSQSWAQKSQPLPQQSQPLPQKSQPLPQQSQSRAQKSQPSPQQSQSQSQAPVPYTAIQEKLTKSVAGQLALSIPVRRNPNVCGTLGRRIMVEVNVMGLELKNIKTNVTQYDVTITPDKPKFLRRTVFEAFRKKKFPTRNPAYDGNKIAYSANDLPFPTYINDIVTILDNNQEREFQVEMKKTTSIDFSFLKDIRPGFNETLAVQSGMQALEVILRHGPLSYYIPVGRSIFWPPINKPENLTNGMELWVGSFQSAVLGWKPLFNIDVAHKGFPKSQNVIELLREMCLRGENRDITPDDVYQYVDKIKKHLVGLKVHYVIPNIPSSKRTQIVRGFVDCPRKNVFSRADGTSCTIEKYFKNEKNYVIRYPYLPCLWIGPENKKIYVPPELCTIVAGQTIRKKMDEIQTSKMIRFAATSTDKRKEKIMEGFRALRINDHPTMRNEFNFSIKPEFERVPARVLDAPKLNYNNNNIVSVTKGVWRPKKFLNPSTLFDNQWTIVNLVDKIIRDRELYNLCNMLQEGAKAVGMVMGNALKPFQSCYNNVTKLLHCFGKLKDNGVKLIIVIIPEFNDSYSTVKQVTELRLGVLTQCIKSITVQRKLNPATIGNILLKINSKLNGVNHEISGQVRPSILTPDCILIGADVTHPSPDSKDIPSIAAVAASCDRTAFRYKIEIRLQQPRQEIINDFAEIVSKLLKYYHKTMGIYPKKIIVYRDGVSEGQLTQVLHFELLALRKGFDSVSTDYNPLITFLVVQKRHHIRFFPTDTRNSDDKNFNVQAGTIVDTHITHPSHIDFYLVSHASIQGTARPTKYKCVFNELNMTEDQIEELTYYLCHMFARCTRSISYPAPTYYAHLAAFRARAFIQNVPIKLQELSKEQEKVRVVLNEDVPMFYV